MFGGGTDELVYVRGRLILELGTVYVVFLREEDCILGD